MIKALSKKSEKTKKRLIAGAAGTVSLLMLPLWFIGFEKALQHKAPSAPPDPDRQEVIYTLNKMKDEFSETFEYFENLINQLSEIENATETPPSTVPQNMPTLPLLKEDGDISY